MPKIKLFFTIIGLTVLIISLVKIINWEQRFTKVTGLSAATVLRLVFNTGAPLKQSDNRINVLLLGMAGGKHEGADLTDTIIVMSINSSKRSMALISIPRDIWSDTLKDRVNSAYHYGEEKKTGGGIILAKVIVEDVVGIPVHYGFAVDFSGFKDIIDLVGGIQVKVPEAFTDPEFPIEGKEEDACNGDPTFACRYEALHFDAGTQLMDGERALKYVRSRHAEGEEGSDFARSRRQQDVLVALKDKLISPGIWLSVGRTRLLLQAIDRATDTDMNVGEIATMAKMAATLGPEKIQRISIADHLKVPPAWWYGRYVLIPQEDFSAIHDYIKSQLQ